jgi:hypothetical protein
VGNLHDSISLLWRLELCGAGRRRWRPFAAIAQRLERQGLLFHAAHLAALAGAGGGRAGAKLCC